jgi:hypothetical protein
MTRELDEWQTFDSARDARAHMRRIYDEDRWIGQKFFPLLIVEKDTLEPVCKPMAMRWQMPFASSRGYGSLTLQHDVAKLIIERHAKHGQYAIVYFASDHDPSGLGLQAAWKQALQDFGAVAVFRRIALTIDQVRASDLDIERLGIEVKDGDSRAKAYRAEFGDRCWEADVAGGGDRAGARRRHPLLARCQSMESPRPRDRAGA